ncbi:MAG: KpsF/GutQ family sugar-phosphate isomerase [Flavobacteriales bacterium]
MDLLNRAKLTLKIESEAIAGCINRLDASFAEWVERIHASSGRLIVAGIGKSADIGRKLVATFNSTGTQAAFLHAADALHGDLGLVQSGDIVLCISKSGNSPEIKMLIPLLKSISTPIVALTGNLEGDLALAADFVLDASVTREACPHNLAPTASTAAQLALGDALAMCLMEARGFSADDFAASHPGGALGKRLYTRVSDLLDADRKPAVSSNASLESVVLSMSEGRYGATVVTDDGQRILGIVTDGDLRRGLERGLATGQTAGDLMTPNPQTISPSALAVEAFQWMEAASITSLVVSEEDKYLGLIHLHDILREGIF